MNCFKKIFSVVLAGLILMNSSLFLPVSAAEEPDDFVPPTETTAPEESAPTDNNTVPTEGYEEETIPQETEESVPQGTEETIPDETTPEETIPEETQPQPAEPDHTGVEIKVYNDVPLFFQNDYPDTMFGTGTVATSGCSITCLAMVATYMTGHTYYPDELAGYFGPFANNNMERMLYGVRQMKLPYSQCENWHVVMEELRQGKVVILLVDQRSIFTEGQHFVVLTGLTQDGKVLVNDSNAKNYERWDLKEKLITGFLESDLWRGFDGAWAFDKDAMPADPFIYQEEEVKVDPRYVGVTLTMDERELLARMVWVESRGEPFEGQQAVAEVVLNRLVAGNFQDSVESIIMAEGQFNSARFLDDAEPNQTQYAAVERALKGPYVTPINTVYFGQTANPNGSVWKRIAGHVFCRQWIE